MRRLISAMFRRQMSPKLALDHQNVLNFVRLGAVARSEACLLGMQAAPSSIPTSGTFFVETWVMKKFLWPFSLFRWFKNSYCQLLGKEYALSTGKLPRRLAQEQWGKGNWPHPKWPKMCWRAVKQKNKKDCQLVAQILTRSRVCTKDWTATGHVTRWDLV